jgi:transcriptional regulator with XRE-family HTH domain
MIERERRLARLFRAESLKSQTEIEAETGIDRADLANYEGGKKIKPSPEHLALLAASAQLTVAAGEQILELSDTLRQARQRPGRGAGELFAELEETGYGQRAWERFLRLRLPDPPPSAEDRTGAREQVELLKELSGEQRQAVVRVVRELRTWALAEQAVEISAAAAEAGDLSQARVWAGLAVDLARTVSGTNAWRNRMQGFALAQEARVLKAAGDRRAPAVLAEARKLWHAGADPGNLLAAGPELQGS